MEDEQFSDIIQAQQQAELQAAHELHQDRFKIVTMQIIEKNQQLARLNTAIKTATFLGAMAMLPVLVRLWRWAV